MFLNSSTVIANPPAASDPATQPLHNSSAFQEMSAITQSLQSYCGNAGKTVRRHTSFAVPQRRISLLVHADLYPSCVTSHHTGVCTLFASCCMQSPTCSVTHMS